MKESRHTTAVHKGQTTSAIKIDTSLIPAEVKNDLAAATLSSYLAYIREPGNLEKLEARIAAKKAAAAAT